MRPRGEKRRVLLAFLAALALSLWGLPHPAHAGCRTVWADGQARTECTVDAPPQNSPERERSSGGQGDSGGPDRTESGKEVRRIPPDPGKSGDGSGQGSGTPPGGKEQQDVYEWVIYLPGGRCARQTARVVRDVGGVYASPKFGAPVEVPCEQPRQVAKFCDRLVWDGSGLVCDKAGAFSLVRASVSLPAVSVDFSPYPAAIVGLPVQARLSGQPLAAGEGVLPRFPPDAGGECRGESEDNAGTPPDGTFKDVRLVLTLSPLGPGVEVTLPIGTTAEGRAAAPIDRAFWVSETPTDFVFPLPSHPDARLYGATVMELPLTLHPETARAGTPAFVGRVRAPYMLSYAFSYQQAVGIYRDVEETYCGPDWQEKGCETRKVPHRFGCNWVGHSESGVIPAGEISGLPPELADPAFPGAIMNPNFVVRGFDPTPGARRAPWEVARGGPFYYVVREVQSLLRPAGR